MRFKKLPQLPGAGRTRAGHHHGSHTPTSPEAVLLGKMAHHTKQIRRECILLEIVYLIIKPSYFFLDKHCTSNLIVQFTLKCKCYYLLWGLFSRVEWQFLYFGIWVSQRDLQWPRRGHRDHQYWPCLDLEIRPKYWKRVCNQSNHLKIIEIS